MATGIALIDADPTDVTVRAGSIDAPGPITVRFIAAPPTAGVNREAATVLAPLAAVGFIEAVALR